MTQLHDTTTSHKGTHLKLGERYQIEVLIKEGLRPSQIAQRLGRHRTTITNEIERGTVRIVKQRQTSQSGKVYTYYAEEYSALAGQSSYETARLACGRRPKWIELADFMDWADNKMLNEKWSPEEAVR